MPRGMVFCFLHTSTNRVTWHLADTPILGGGSTSQVASQPPNTTNVIEQPQKTHAQVVPVTETAPADLVSKGGSNGMPQGYSARTVKDSDDISMKHAGLLPSPCCHLGSRSVQKVFALQSKSPSQDVINWFPLESELVQPLKSSSEGIS